jgi:AraC-like DNA-binding protein
MNLIGAIALCGAMLGALLATALRLVQGRNRIANDILALFVLVFAVHLLLLAPLLNERSFNILPIYPLFLTDVFLFGPLLYLYVRAMTEPAFRLRYRDGLHGLPFVVFICVSLLVNDSQRGALHSLHNAAARGWPPSPAALVGIAFYLSFSIYMLLSLRLLRRHGRLVRQHFSWLEGVNLRWLRILVRVSFVLSLIGLTLSLVRLFVDLEFWPRGAYSMVMMIALFHLIAFMAIWQPAVFHAEAPHAPVPGNDEVLAGAPESVGATAKESGAQEPSPKYETSALTGAQVQGEWARLQAFMEQQRLYLDNELRLGQLASAFGIPAHHLSQIINQGAGQHFLEFITAYRIEEAKRLLAREDYRDTKMVALALDAGFNSQSAFYKQFRKHVGMTPSQYQQLVVPVAGQVVAG